MTQTIIQMYPPPYLLPDELQVITGYARKAKQRDWLRRKKIEFRPNAFGLPIVSRAHWEQATGAPPKDSLPNWEVMKKG